MQKSTGNQLFFETLKRKKENHLRKNSLSLLPSRKRIRHILQDCWCEAFAWTVGNRGSPCLTGQICRALTESLVQILCVRQLFSEEEMHRPVALSAMRHLTNASLHRHIQKNRQSLQDSQPSGLISSVTTQQQNNT